MKDHQVKLHRKGDVLIILRFSAKDRYEVEEVARRYIERGLAESMGAIDELS